MQTQSISIETQAIFVNYISVTKAGNTALILSDGISEQFFATNCKPETFADLVRGDIVNIEMTINPFSNYSKKVTEVTKA